MKLFGSGLMVAILLLASAAGLGAQVREVTFDGSWSGTTSQGQAISFTVVDNTITTITVGIYFMGTFTGGTCNYGPFSRTNIFSPDDSYNLHKPITGKTFSFSNPSPDPSSGVDYTITGTFSSNTSVSGTLVFTGKTNVVGAPRCSGTANATWNATKK